MAAVAAITTWEANKVAARLDRAVETYIPAYAALARADVRSLEQALAMRRLVIGELTGAADEAARNSEFPFRIVGRLRVVALRGADGCGRRGNSERDRE